MPHLWTRDLNPRNAIYLKSSSILLCCLGFLIFKTLEKNGQRSYQPWWAQLAILYRTADHLRSNIDYVQISVSNQLPTNQLIMYLPLRWPCPWESYFRISPPEIGRPVFQFTLVHGENDKPQPGQPHVDLRSLVCVCVCVRVWERVMSCTV